MYSSSYKRKRRDLPTSYRYPYNGQLLTKLTPVLSDLCLEFLDVASHLAVLTSNKAWAERARRPQSWCKYLTFYIKGFQRISVSTLDDGSRRISSYARHTFHDNNPHFTCGMLSSFTRSVHIHADESAYSSVLKDSFQSIMETVWNEICNKCTRLETLIVEPVFLHLTTERLEQVATHFKHLKQLKWQAGRRPIDDPTADNKVQVDALVSLRHLQHVHNLAALMFAPGKIDKFAHLELTTLTLNNIRYDYWDHPVPSAHYPSTSHLGRLTGSLPTLTTLSLFHYQIDKSSTVTQFTNLTDLNVSTSRMTDQVLLEICKSKMGLKILKLDFVETMTLEGFQHVRCLAPTLTELDVSHLTTMTDQMPGVTMGQSKNLTDEMVADTVGHLKRLVKFTAWNSSVGDKTCATLAGLRELTSVDLCGSKAVTRDGILMLGDLPKLVYVCGANMYMPELQQLVRKRIASDQRENLVADITYDTNSISMRVQQAGV